MRRILASATVAVILGGACSNEPAAPVQNATARPPSLNLLDKQTFVAVSYGLQVQLHPTLSDTLGKSIAIPVGLSVVSRDTTVVRVDNSYLMTSVGVGETRIVASVNYGGRVIVDSLTVSVLCGEFVVGFTPLTQTLVVGQSFTAKVQVHACNQTDTITWSSSDASIVSVDPTTGQSTAVAVGRAAVRASGVRFGALGGIPVTVNP